MKRTSYHIDFINQTINITKTFAKKAGIAKTPEQEEMMELLKAYPGFAVKHKEISRNASKKTHKGLTFNTMRDYILERAGEEAAAGLDKVIALSKVERGNYARVKKWFLTQYPDYAEYAPMKQTA